MKRWAVWVGALVVVLAAGVAPAHAQNTFKIPFTLQAGGARLPKGEYSVSPKDSTHLVLRQESTGKEFLVPFTGRLPRPRPPIAQPQLVIAVVGNFAPSYTEYVTDYVLSEVWLPGTEGFLVHTFKGGHQTRIIKGEKAK